MAEIGCLGNVIFVVSREKILTPGNGVEWNSGAKWAEHDRHMQSPALEFTGLEADSIVLPIHLSKLLGVDPMKQIWELFDYERNGTPVSLTIGNHAYGRYKWVIKNSDRTLERFDGKGNLLVAEISLSLKGYVK